MAKARLLAAEFLLSYEFSLLQTDSALAFLYTVPHWDRDGLLDGDAVWSLPQLMLGRQELHSRVSLFVKNWVDAKIISSYEVVNRRILHWPKFRIYNSNIITTRESPSKYPPPPGWHRTPAGLVPDDENELYNLLMQIDPRSSYRLALENELALQTGKQPNTYGKRHHDEREVHHDRSCATRADQQDQDQSVVAVDQSIHPSLVKVTGGAGGAATNRDYKIESLGQLDHRQLVAVAMYAGAGLGLLDEWVGYLDHLITLNETGLNTLIRWIAFYAVQTPEQMARVNSHTAVIRANINEGRHPSISAKMRDFLNEITDKVLDKEQAFDL